MIGRHSVVARMPNEFQFPASGFLRPLSDGVKRKIERRFPALPIATIEKEFSFYVLEEEAARAQPSPDAVRTLLRSMRKDAQRIIASAQKLGNARRLLAGMSLRPFSLRELTSRLDEAAEVFALTAGKIPPGHYTTPEERLVRGLTGILRAASKTPDAKPNGALVQLMGILLTDADPKRERKDVRKLVARALSKLDKPA